MEKIKNNPGLIALMTIVLIAAIFRIIPHPPNFTPIAAMALFGGAYFTNKKLAFLVPLAAMLLSDLIIGFHTGMPIVYFSFALMVLIGMRIGKNINPKSIVVGALSASIMFFLITNFAVWMRSITFSNDLAGLIACYIAGIPFFQNTLLGDFVFTSALFGGFYLVKQKFPALAK